MTNEVVGQIQSYPVNFIIKRIINNDENARMRMKLELDIQTSQGILSGPGVLQMCSCYCDSIWDAWPSGVGTGIEGQGTMYLLSSSEGDIPSGPQVGVLGIQMVEGGIERETEFRLAASLLIED